MVDKKSVMPNSLLFKAVGTSLLISVSVMILGCMLLTTFIISGSISERGTGYYSMGLITIGTMCGSVSIRKSRSKNRLLAVCVYASIIVCMLLLVNLVVMEGVFENALLKIAGIFIGVSIGVIGIREKKRSARGKLYKTHNR